MATRAQGEPNQRIHPPSSPASAYPKEALWKCSSSAEDAAFTFAVWKPKGKLNTSRLVKILQVNAQKMWCHAVASSITQKKFQEAKQKEKKKVLITCNFPLAVWGGSRVLLRIQDLFYTANSPCYLLSWTRLRGKEGNHSVCLLKSASWVTRNRCLHQGWHWHCNTLPSSKKEVLQTFFFFPSSKRHGSGAWIIHLASRKESTESQIHDYFSWESPLSLGPLPTRRLQELPEFTEVLSIHGIGDCRSQLQTLQEYRT